MKPSVEMLESRDCPATPFVVSADSPALLGAARQLRNVLVRDLEPLASGRLGSALTVRVHAGEQSDDNLPASGSVIGKVAHVYAVAGGERQTVADMRISVLQSVALAGFAMTGVDDTPWFWDYDNPKDVMNGGDGVYFGGCDDDAGLVGDGAAWAGLFLRRR